MPSIEDGTARGCPAREGAAKGRIAAATAPRPNSRTSARRSPRTDEGNCNKNRGVERRRGFISTRRPLWRTCRTAHIFLGLLEKLDMADKQDFDREALESALTELGRRAYAAGRTI